MASTHVFSVKATAFMRQIAGLEDHTVESLSGEEFVQEFMDQFCPTKAPAKKKSPKAKKPSPPRDPSEISTSKCQCRVWNKGDGGQCRGNPEKDSIMCKRHAAEALHLYEESTPEDAREDLDSEGLAEILCEMCENGDALGWMGIVTASRPTKPTDKKGKALTWTDQRTSKKKSVEKPKTVVKPKTEKTAAKPKAEKADAKPKKQRKVKKADPLPEPVKNEDEGEQSVPEEPEQSPDPEPVPEPEKDDAADQADDSSTVVPDGATTAAQNDVGCLDDFDLDDSDEDEDEEADDVEDWPKHAIDGVYYHWNKNGDKMIIGVQNGKTVGTLESEDSEIDFLNDAARQAHEQAVSELA